jgi:lipopolysaccharide biosynthesis glycosyltransferase
MSVVLSDLGIIVSWCSVEAGKLEELPLPANTWLSKATFARIFLADILPVEVERVIYLDSDTLVLSDLSDLYYLDVGSCPLAACIAPQCKRVEDSRSRDALIECGLSGELPYFNAGVLLLNLNQWREMALVEKITNLVKEKGAILMFADQDALNITFSRSVEWFELDPHWNVATSSFSSEDSLAMSQTSQPWIIHYTGPKPDDRYCQHPLAGHFYRVVKASNWFNPLAYWRWYFKILFQRQMHVLRQRLKHLNNG